MSNQRLHCSDSKDLLQYTNGSFTDSGAPICTTRLCPDTKPPSQLPRRPPGSTLTSLPRVLTSTVSVSISFDVDVLVKIFYLIMPFPL